MASAHRLSWASRDEARVALVNSVILAVACVITYLLVTGVLSALPGGGRPAESIAPTNPIHL